MTPTPGSRLQNESLDDRMNVEGVDMKKDQIPSVLE